LGAVQRSGARQVDDKTANLNEHQHEDQALDIDKLLSTERRHGVGPATEPRRPSRAASLRKRNQITMTMMMIDAKQNITRNQQHITIKQPIKQQIIQTATQNTTHSHDRTTNYKCNHPPSAFVGPTGRQAS
jgi:hypothetical protein